MDKAKIMIYLDDEVAVRLSKIGDRYGISRNQVVSMIAGEVSRIRPEDLWQVLGQITKEANVEIVAKPAARRPRSIANQEIEIPA